MDMLSWFSRKGEEMKWNWESRLMALFMGVYLIYNIVEGTAGVPLFFLLVFVIGPWVWNHINKLHRTRRRL